jgi:hypothetical protein
VARERRFGQIECIASTPGFSERPFLFVSLWVLHTEMWDDESEDPSAATAPAAVPAPAPAAAGATSASGAMKKLNFDDAAVSGGGGGLSVTVTSASGAAVPPGGGGGGGGSGSGGLAVAHAVKRRLFYQLVPRDVMALAPDTEVRLVLEGRMIHMVCCGTLPLCAVRSRCSRCCVWWACPLIAVV